MSATYEKVSSNKAKLSFTVPAEQFEAAGLSTFLVGSAETPGRIAGAVRSGFEKAWVFQAE